MAEIIVLQDRAAALARKGRQWFFRDDLEAAGGGHGDLVRVRDRAGRDLGLGMCSTASRFPLRRCGPWTGDEVPGREEFFARRLEEALAARRGRWGPRAAVRLVHGDADALPGLVVDAYDRALVLQSTVAAVEANLDAIVPWLVEHTGAISVLARNDLAIRDREGLPREVRLLHGRPVERAEFIEDGVVHEARLFRGHKTGFYLDQALARALVQKLAAGRTVLDLFSYQGAFALAALKGGARSAVAVDQSAGALEAARSGAERNGLAGLETREANVFDELRTLRTSGASFGLVVLDPPAFAKSRREVRGAQRGYRDLNRLALRLLEPGGHLVTSSCSHHVTLPMFEDLLGQAARGLPFRAVLRQRLGAGPDHPVVLHLPESEYLKVLHIQRLG